MVKYSIDYLTMTDDHRTFKDRLYGQFARLGKALASPHRIEMLELLAQGERTVDSLAAEIGLSLANASQHLQVLRQAALVESRKDGLFVFYRLVDPSVFALCAALHTVAERRLADLDRLVREHFGDRADAEPVRMRDREYVAYCRGPYCIYADRAVELLRKSRRRARRLLEGFPEWRAAGFPIAQGEELAIGTRHIRRNRWH